MAITRREQVDKLHQLESEKEEILFALRYFEEKDKKIYEGDVLRIVKRLDPRTYQNFLDLSEMSLRTLLTEVNDELSEMLDEEDYDKEDGAK